MVVRSKKIDAYEGELVVKGSEVHLYVIKDHKAMKPSADMTAAVRLFVNNAERTVELKPEGDKLVGKTATPATSVAAFWPSPSGACQYRFLQ